ncbi:MAG: hypothetical protein GY717_05855 [Rhodobacteraceae bacterium]|nr:hypothetical protein [Paracoccaceae bacterium]
MTRTTPKMKYASLTLAAGALSLNAGLAQADIVHLDDVIVNGSLCVGVDCVNGESFGFDTIRLKENNLRVRFMDTSSSSSFPSGDWQITVNDSANGGANKFSIDDIDGGLTPFTVEAGAPSHSLYVDDGGRIGFGTSTPVVDLHLKSGNTPTLRLEQDGSSGFTPQTWDVAGNEANFFVRDATNGSTLPLRIRPGAPSSAIDIAADGNIGMGTDSPAENLHIRSTAASDNAEIRLESTNSAGSGSGIWELVTRGVDGEFAINDEGAEGAEFILSGPNSTTQGLRILGTVTATTAIVVGSTTLNVPDYVFAEDYELMPLEDLQAFITTNRHLPNVPSAAEVNASQLNMTEMQMSLLEKVEELTLYTIGQQARIDVLQQEIEALRTQ